jgi:DMSO/TMAO reductase YedYZ molybdopterin-dependent catalytic subunit
LADLARLVGVGHIGTTRLESLGGGDVELSGAQASAAETMLALRVNGADLSLDHGYPARVVVPSAPGTFNRKWMTRIVFAERA